MNKIVREKLRCIVKSFLCFWLSFFVFLVGVVFWSTTELTFEVIYWLTWELSVVWPFGYVQSWSISYISWNIDFWLTASTDASYKLYSSRDDSLNSWLVILGGSIWSDYISSDDGYLFVTWTITNLSGYYFPYNKVEIFKDSTPPKHSGIWTMSWSSTTEDISFAWSPAYDTWVGGTFYKVRLEWLDGQASGVLLTIHTLSTSVLIQGWILYPWNYSISIWAYDQLGNKSFYSPIKVFYLDWQGIDVVDVDDTNGVVTTFSRNEDICLCWDFSWSPYDYRCTPSNEKESLYSENYCSFLIISPADSDVPDIFAEQWPVITERFLNIVEWLPSDLGIISSLELPWSQIIYSRYDDKFWEKLHIVLRSQYSWATWSSISFDRPFVQWEVKGGILYITYIDEPELESYLCVNCCSTASFAITYHTRSNLLWYVWWCEPLWLLIVLILFLVIILLDISYKSRK